MLEEETSSEELFDQNEKDIWVENLQQFYAVAGGSGRESIIELLNCHCEDDVFAFARSDQALSAALINTINETANTSFTDIDEVIAELPGLLKKGVRFKTLVRQYYNVEVESQILRMRNGVGANRQENPSSELSFLNQFNLLTEEIINPPYDGIEVILGSPESALIVAIEKFFSETGYKRFVYEDKPIITDGSAKLTVSGDFAIKIRGFFVDENNLNPDFKKYPLQISHLFDALAEYENERHFIFCDEEDVEVWSIRPDSEKGSLERLQAEDMQRSIVSPGAHKIHLQKGPKLIHIQGFGRRSGMDIGEINTMTLDEMAKQLSCLRRMANPDMLDTDAGTDAEAETIPIQMMGVSFNKNSYYKILSETYALQSNLDFFSTKAQHFVHKVFQDLIPDIPLNCEQEKKISILNQVAENFSQFVFTSFSYGSVFLKQVENCLIHTMESKGYALNEIHNLLSQIKVASYTTLYNLQKENGYFTTMHVTPMDGVVEVRTDNLSGQEKLMPGYNVTEGIGHYCIGNGVVLCPGKINPVSRKIITYIIGEKAGQKEIAETFIGSHHWYTHNTSGTKLPEPNDTRITKVLPGHPAADVVGRFIRRSLRLMVQGYPATVNILDEFTGEALTRGISRSAEDYKKLHGAADRLKRVQEGRRDASRMINTDPGGFSRSRSSSSNSTD